MNVYVGIDLSIRATGLSAIRGTGQEIERKLIETEARTPYPQRIAHIADEIVAFLSKHRPELAGTEEMAMHASFNSGTLFPLHGAVIYAIQKAGIQHPVRISPSTLKKFTTGSGIGDKSSMKMLTLKKWGLEFKDDNECDAYACARLAGVLHGGIPAGHKYEEECVKTVKKKEATRA